MKNKNRLIEIFNEMNVEYQEYLSVGNTILKINEISDDLEKVSILEDKDLDLLNEESKRIIEYIIKFDDYDKAEVQEALKYIKNILVSRLNHDNNYYEELGAKISYFSGLVNAINYDIKNNYNLILEFIRVCYKEKKITLEEAISLNLEVVEGSISDKKIVEVEEEEVELFENEEPIYNELKELFIKYDYDFEKLNARTRDQFNKYARLDYTEYILSKLKYYGVTQRELVANQTEILMIIIDKKGNTFDEVCDFIDNNDCTMSKILSFSAIFHKRNKSYVPHKQTGINDGRGPGNHPDFKIVGTFDDFMTNLELLKAIEGIDNISDKDLYKKHKFLISPPSLIKKNLEILRKYGVCGPDELPTQATSLIGKFTAYQLDRFIELGLYDYIKKNLSYVNHTKCSFKFYKIRRAFDVGDSIFKGRGIAEKYGQNKYDANGIEGVRIAKSDGSETAKIDRIIQKKLSASTLDSIPSDIKREVGEWDNLTGEQYYRKLNGVSYIFHEKTPNDVFPKGSISNIPERLRYIFKSDNYDIIDYDDDSVLNDKYIKMLDTSYALINENGSTSMYDIKSDENTYVFRNKKYPGFIIRISRQKVLRLCKLLMDNGFWISDDFYLEDRVNMLLAILVKDSVLSNWEVSTIRNILTHIMGSMDKNYNTGRGVR